MKTPIAVPLKKRRVQTTQLFGEARHEEGGAVPTQVFRNVATRPLQPRAGASCSTQSRNKYVPTVRVSFATPQSCQQASTSSANVAAPACSVSQKDWATVVGQLSRHQQEDVLDCKHGAEVVGPRAIKADRFDTEEEDMFSDNALDLSAGSAEKPSSLPVANGIRPPPTHEEEQLHTERLSEKNKNIEAWCDTVERQRGDVAIARRKSATSSETEQITASLPVGEIENGVSPAPVTATTPADEDVFNVAAPPAPENDLRAAGLYTAPQINGEQVLASRHEDVVVTTAAPVSPVKWKEVVREPDLNNVNVHTHEVTGDQPTAENGTHPEAEVLNTAASTHASETHTVLPTAASTVGLEVNGVDEKRAATSEEIPSETAASTARLAQNVEMAPSVTAPVTIVIPAYSSNIEITETTASPRPVSPAAAVERINDQTIVDAASPPALPNGTSTPAVTPPAVPADLNDKDSDGSSASHDHNYAVRKTINEPGQLAEHDDKPEADIEQARSNNEHEAVDAASEAARDLDSNDSSDDNETPPSVGARSNDQSLLCPLPRGVITKSQWDEFSFRCGIVPDHRPVITQLLAACHELVDAQNEVTNTRSLNAVCTMHRIMNDQQDLTPPSMTDLGQLMHLINKFLQKYPDYIEDEASPCMELSVIYQQARDGFERELNVIIEATDRLLSDKTIEEQEEGTAAGYSHTNKVLRRVNELAEEMTVHRNARVNLESENAKMRKDLDDLKENRNNFASSAQSLKSDNDELRTKMEVLQAKLSQAESTVRRVEKDKAKLLESHTEAVKVQGEQHTRALSDQRKSHELALEREVERARLALKEKDELIEKQRKEVQEAEKGQRIAQQAYATEHKKHQLCKEARPASDREVQLLKQQVESVLKEAESYRLTLVDTEVKLQEYRRKLGESVDILRNEGRFMHGAARDMYTPALSIGSDTSLASPIRPPAPGVPAPPLSVPTGVRFNYEVEKMKAERKYVSEEPLQPLIPDDLLGVEPMITGPVYYDVPCWDMYPLQ